MRDYLSILYETTRIC